MRFELDHWPLQPSRGDTNDLTIVDQKKVGRSTYYEVAINNDDYVIVRKSKFLWWTRYHFSGNTGMLNGMADTSIEIYCTFFKECDQRKKDPTPFDETPSKRDEWISPRGISSVRKLQDIDTKQFHFESINASGAAILLSAIIDITN